MTSPILDSVTELSLVRLRSMPEEQAAKPLDSRLRVLEDAYKNGFVERGLILLEFQERQLWRWLFDFAGDQYPSFESWVVSAAPHSRSDCFAAMRAVRELREIPRDQLSDIPRCNIEVMRTLSSEVRSNPDVIEAAKILPEKEFVSKMKSDHPNQHIEAKHKLTFRLEESAEEIILKTLDRVGHICGLADREGQLERLAADWWEENNDAEPEA